jgi:hypothetical protein
MSNKDVLQVADDVSTVVRAVVSALLPTVRHSGECRLGEGQWRCGVVANNIHVTEALPHIHSCQTSVRNMPVQELALWDPPPEANLKCFSVSRSLSFAGMRLTRNQKYSSILTCLRMHFRGFQGHWKHVRKPQICRVQSAIQ